MNLQQVIKSGKMFKRIDKGTWLLVVDGKVSTVNAMINYNLHTDDILADDWEIEEDKPSVISIIDSDGQKVSFGWSLENEFIINGEYDITKEGLDKILTFLYNNTEIGKSRIIPF